MTNLRNHAIGLTILFAIAGCSAIGIPAGSLTPAPRDHYDPAFLNEAAVAAWSRGERGTALLLLERAAVIAPHDQRILDNLQAAKRAGSRSVRMHDGPVADREAATSETATSAFTPATAVPEITLWPRR